MENYLRRLLNLIDLTGMQESQGLQLTSYEKNMSFYSCSDFKEMCLGILGAAFGIGEIVMLLTTPA